MSFFITNPTTIERMAYGHSDKETVEPHSLIMTISQCEYCGKSGHDNTYDVQLDHNFGIICCEEHISKANNDIITFAKNRGIMFVHSELLPIETYTIIRTDGSIDIDWSIYADFEKNYNKIWKNENKEWMIRVEKNGKTKGVTINHLIEMNPNKKEKLVIFKKKLDESLDKVKNKKELYLDN
jgi:hypothetical protein